MRRSGKTEYMRVVRRGPRSVPFEGREIILCDQDRLHKGHIEFKDGFTFEEVIEHLNKRVFFWPGTYAGPIGHGKRHFNRYDDEQHVILRVDFPSLTALNAAITPLFCPYNSGSPRCTNGNKSPRGPTTFLPAEAFNGTACRVVEVTFNKEVLLPPTTQFGSSPEGPWRKLA